MERAPHRRGIDGVSLWRRLGTSGRNLATTASAEVVIRLVVLAYLMALARFLEPDAFGVFNTLLAYFTLAVTLGNLGLDQLALRQLSIDSDARVFATLLWLRLLAAGATAGLLVVAARIVPTPSAALFGPLAVAVLPAGAASAFTARFKAREAFGVPSAASTAGALVMAALSFAGVARGASLSFFVWALAASEVVRALWLVVATHELRVGAVRAFDPAFARRALRSAVPYAILTILGVIYFRIDLIMLDAMVGGEEVGQYAGAYRILEPLIFVPGLVMAVLFPRLARGQRTESREAGDLYLGVSRILVWAGLSVAVLGIALAGPALTLLFSEAYAAGTSALIWLMTALIFVFWHAPNVAVLFSGEKLGPVVRFSFLTAGFNVVVNLVLIPRYGGAGAAAATAASELLSWSIFTPMVLSRLGVDPLDYLRSVAIPRMSRAELRLLLGREDRGGLHGGSHAR